MLFVKHLWFWFVVMIFFVLTMPIIPTNDWFSTDAELRSNDRFYGQVANREYVRRAKARFESWFVKTGVYHKSLELTENKRTKATRSSQSEMIDVEVSMFNTYVRQAWDGMLRALYRWETNKHWYAILLVSMLASINDGISRRTIQPATVMYRSPANFHMIGHFLLANVFGAILVLPWLPLAMTWWMWMIGIAALCPFWVWAVVSLPTLKPQALN